ncbi:TPA: DUF927 domain-containing protein [Klebsiella quasipneumoniae subsp. similipneumoniae]|nr:DUF927 domain-containing protein [Klebsiella pneumoniae]MDF9973048.1 DUF927 domain-containing protein [Klebsiella pneumoniae]HBT5242136.1 DUF927 domain-containing protein [Klebsiella quasipneumoniae]HDH1860628.1 DUF927 domain-containing protein [Klebsiella quasipneumoniae subsp. similipneumoniae]HEP0615089.1 DUF927 domain-containing protein [Klebsiella quasipneumoniae subsp. similipneumoniae]
MPDEWRDPEVKNAPNLKHLPREKFTEAVIFAGTDAYAHAKGWEEGLGKQVAEDTTPPIYLGPKQLAELANLNIVDKGRRSARVYLAGDIEPIQINAIGEKLALAGVQDAKLYKGIPDRQPEDWHDYLSRLREQAERRESTVVDLPVKKRESKPTPSDELKPRVDSRHDGLYWITPKVDKDSGEIINNETWLCSPLEVVGSGSDGAERYLVLRWRSPRGHEDITRAIPCADIGERDGWRSLKAGGVNVTTKSTFRAILADWLQQSGTHREWIITHTTGWHHGAYIMPDGEVVGDPETPILFNGRSAASSGYAIAGTAATWRDSVARLAGGNPSMMLGVAAALSAPLIGLVGADGFGVHLFEQSSAGKTTTSNIASSLWGEPDALRLTWYGTALGIANEAEAHNDSLLPLDEVGQGSSAKDVATSAYTLFNGAGKLQGAKEGGNRELKRWRTVAISTGEMDIETFLSAGGIRVKAGQLVRLLNIPMEKSTVFNGLPNGKAHADALKEAWIDNHGAAGREWVKWLAAHQEDAKQAVRDAQTRWRGLIPADYGEQVHRVAERFAILEAALVTGGAITGWSEQASRDAIQHSFNAWVKEFGTGNKEHQQIIEQCEAFLNAYGLSRFAPLPYDPASLPISNLAGYRKRKSSHDDAPLVFYTFPATFEKEIAQGFNARQFARALASAGVLSASADGQRFQQKSPRIDGRQINVYVLQYQADGVKE